MLFAAASASAAAFASASSPSLRFFAAAKDFSAVFRFSSEILRSAAFSLSCAAVSAHSFSAAVSAESAGVTLAARSAAAYVFFFKSNSSFCALSPSRRFFRSSSRLISAFPRAAFSSAVQTDRSSFSVSASCLSNAASLESSAETIFSSAPQSSPVSEKSAAFTALPSSVSMCSARSLILSNMPLSACSASLHRCASMR